MPHEILIVEDSATQAESLRLLLEANDYAVTVARSAEQAIDCVARRDFDLVLSDVVMPGADGYALTNRIKNEMNRPQLMVILLTTLGDPLDIVRGLAAGADNYVTKPYEPEVLLTRVRHVLEGRDRRRLVKASVGVQLDFLGVQFTITSEKEQILDLLLSSVEDIVRTNRALQSSRRELAEAHEQLRRHADRMRHQAQISTGRYQTLMQDVWSAIFVLDPGGRILETNARAARLLDAHRRHDAPAGAAPSLMQLVVPSERGRLAGAMSRLPEARHVELRDLQLGDDDARPSGYWDLSLAISPGDTQDLVLVVAHDVTENRETERRLRESEARYRLLFERIPAPLWVYDVETLRFLTVNEAAVRHYGFSREEFREMTLADIRPPEERRQLATLVPEVTADGVHCEVRHWRKDGTLMDVRIIGHPIEFGGRGARLVLAEDVTEQRRIAAQLQSRARQQAAIAELGQRALADPDPDVLVAGAVKLVAETLGVELVQALELAPNGHELVVCAGSGWRDGVVGHLRLGVDRMSMAGLAMVEREPVVVEDLRTEGRFVPVPVALEHGAVSGLAVVIPGTDTQYGVLAAFATSRRRFDVDDVNFLRGVAATIGATVERARSVRALHESEERGRTILDSLGEGVMLVTREGIVQWCNRSAGRFLGVSPQEIGGRSTAALGVRLLDEEGAPLSPEAHPSAIALRTGEAAPREVLISVDGRPPRRVLAAARALARAGETAPYAAVVSFIDVTDQRRLEQQLLQSQRLEAVGRLAGGVAHDFNNILTVIRSYGDLVCDGLDQASPMYADMLEITKAADRATALTRQLLTVGRRSVVLPQPLSLSEVVANLETLLLRLLREDLELSLSLDPALPSVVADPGQLEQVLMNLVVNARDAMPNGGRIAIETRAVRLDPVDMAGLGDLTPGPYALLAVSDTGTGIPAAIRDHIFEPFFTTKEQGKGTGLGLATVHGIIKDAGGLVTVYSEPGHGTTFKIYLPLSDLAPVRIADASATPMSAGAGETILVAEDEEAVRRIVGQELRRIGYRVLEAKTGTEALKIATAHTQPIHVLITDMIMPGMNGRDLAAAVRQVHPEARVLYTSGYSGEIISRETMLDPDFSFLEKPFSIGELARRVRAEIEAWSPPGLETSASRGP